MSGTERSVKQRSVDEMDWRSGVERYLEEKKGQEMSGLENRGELRRGEERSGTENK